MVPNRDHHLGGSEQPRTPGEPAAMRGGSAGVGERFPEAAWRGHEPSLGRWSNRRPLAGMSGEIEFILAHCPETNQIYAVPVDGAPATE